MSDPRRIDTHQHLIPPKYAAWLKRKGIKPGGIELPEWEATGRSEIHEPPRYPRRHTLPVHTRGPFRQRRRSAELGGAAALGR